MRWGAPVLAVTLLIALVWVSGCADVSFGSQKIGDFGSTKEELKAVEFFKATHGDPLTNSGPPRFLEPMVTTGLVNNTPVDKVTKFSKETGSIFFWVFYDNFKKGDPLTLTWMFNGKTVITLQREAGGDFGRAFGEFLKPDKGWATGMHTITISGSGTSATATFEIIDGRTQTVPLPYEQASGISTAPQPSPAVTECTSGTTACRNSSVPVTRCVYLNVDPMNCGECGQGCKTGCHCADGYCISDSFKPTERSQTGDFSYPECYKPNVWISGSAFNQYLSCSPPDNTLKIFGDTHDVKPGTLVQMKLFNSLSSVTQDLPQDGILIGNTYVNNDGSWSYIWNGSVTGYTLKNGQDYMIRSMLSIDPNYVGGDFHYSCPSSSQQAQEFFPTLFFDGRSEGSDIIVVYRGGQDASKVASALVTVDSSDGKHHEQYRPSPQVGSTWTLKGAGTSGMDHAKVQVYIPPNTYTVFDTTL